MEVAVVRAIIGLTPIVSIVFLVYAAILTLYRLYLSPLAKFPGPKLAAASFWYEFYYDVIRSGTYTWKLKELHKQYGKS